MTEETAGGGERRQTRAALAEIPLRLGAMRVTPFTPVTNTVAADNSPADLPPGYLSPAPSPDELVIRQRGRRRLPVTWSPDIELKRNSMFYSGARTPPKALPPHASPRALRSTPRKRLLLGEPATDKALTPEKVEGEAAMSTPQKNRTLSPSKGSPAVKRLRLERRESETSAPLELALKALSPVQLAEVVRGLVTKHPELEREVRTSLPAPDLKPLEERLNYLRLNIYRSLPVSRLTSKTDSPAYGRASTHLAAFKKCVVEQGRALLESHAWRAVLEYVVLAWGYVRATPLWDNPPHNAARRACFRSLAACCGSALRRGGATLEPAELAALHEKLQELASDSDELQSAVNYLRQNLLIS